MTDTASAASTLIARTAQFVRRNPLGAVTAAFGGGILLGWLIAHDMKTRFYAGSQRRQQQDSENKAYKRAISRWEGEGGAIPSKMKGGNNE
jgi:hypothetical protein